MLSGFGGWLRRAAGSIACIAGLAAAPHAFAETFLSIQPSAPARELVEWVKGAGDARGRPFAVVDKLGARLYVFHADGRLAGHTPALLGSTRGDHTVPGVGERTQAGTLRLEDRTTPAGRFEAQPGQNDKGEHVVWVDYESAFAIHRLRPGAAYAARAARLASASPQDSRVSWGCVVVPLAFYEDVVEPVLGRARSVVYVLPEVAPVHAVFQALDTY